VSKIIDTWQQVRADWTEFYALDYDPTSARPYTARRHGSDLVITAESAGEMRHLLRNDHERLTGVVR
jgi:hypothetical protein